jgi:hypothetical protein
MEPLLSLEADPDSDNHGKEKEAEHTYMGSMVSGKVVPCPSHGGTELRWLNVER